MAITLINDDKIFKNPFDQNSIITDFITLLWDFSKYIKISIPQKFYVKDIDTPFYSKPVCGFRINFCD